MMTGVAATIYKQEMFVIFKGMIATPPINILLGNSKAQCRMWRP
jgi:hypothetical protein